MTLGKPKTRLVVQTLSRSTRQVMTHLRKARNQLKVVNAKGENHQLKLPKNPAMNLRTKKMMTPMAKKNTKLLVLSMFVTRRANVSFWYTGKVGVLALTIGNRKKI